MLFKVGRPASTCSNRGFTWFRQLLVWTPLVLHLNVHCWLLDRKSRIIKRSVRDVMKWTANGWFLSCLIAWRYLTQEEINEDINVSGDRYLNDHLDESDINVSSRTVFIAVSEESAIINIVQQVRSPHSQEQWVSITKARQGVQYSLIGGDILWNSRFAWFDWNASQSGTGN